MGIVGINLTAYFSGQSLLKKISIRVFDGIIRRIFIPASSAWFNFCRQVISNGREYKGFMGLQNLTTFHSERNFRRKKMIKIWAFPIKGQSGGLSAVSFFQRTKKRMPLQSLTLRTRFIIGFSLTTFIA